MADKRILRVKYTDFWPNFVLGGNIFFRLLSEKYYLCISDDPELVIYSVYGNDFLKYDCVRLHYTGENQRIHFDECDFAIGHDYLPDEPRYQRLPLWVLYGDVNQYTAPRPPAEETLRAKTGFCSMVVSNGACQERNDFFHALSRYKQVASGGRYLNNVGGPVADKAAFVAKYKFSLVFENSFYPGYQTEKLLDGLKANTIPIYWGNPRAGEDFNPRAFLNYSDFASQEALIQRVIELDNDDDQYRAMLAEPMFTDNRVPDFARDETIHRHLDRVVNGIGQITPVGTTARGRKAALRRRTAWAGRKLQTVVKDQLRPIVPAGLIRALSGWRR